MLSNDTDADGDTLSVSSVTTPANGTAVVNADQTVTYTPNTNYAGADSFSYTIGDGQGGSATAQVTLTVVSSDQPPVADTAWTAMDLPIAIPILANDRDVDGDPLTISVQSQPTRGTLVVSAQGIATYTPDAGYTGADSFTYRLSDGLLNSAIVTVSLSVLGMSKFYVVDRGSDRMYGYDAAGANMNSSPLGSANKESRGIATDATASRFWSVDLNKTVTVYNAARNVEGNLTLSGVQNPTGIAMAGNDLYVSDSTARKIHVFAGAASQL
ncbi:MAG: Ig-like domain-containing protein, partial [bacterium]